MSTGFSFIFHQFYMIDCLGAMFLCLEFSVPHHDLSRDITWLQLRIFLHKAAHDARSRLVVALVALCKDCLSYFPPRIEVINKLYRSLIPRARNSWVVAGALLHYTYKFFGGACGALQGIRFYISWYCYYDWEITQGFIRFFFFFWFFFITYHNSIKSNFSAIPILAFIHLWL